MGVHGSCCRPGLSHWRLFWGCLTQESFFAQISTFRFNLFEPFSLLTSCLRLCLSQFSIPLTNASGKQAEREKTLLCHGLKLCLWVVDSMVSRLAWDRASRCAVHSNSTVLISWLLGRKEREHTCTSISASKTHSQQLPFFYEALLSRGPSTSQYRHELWPSFEYMSTGRPLKSKPEKSVLCCC